MNEKVATYILDLKKKHDEALECLQAIVEIGKRDLTNPKYDGYFKAAKEIIKKNKKLC